MTENNSKFTAAMLRVLIIAALSLGQTACGDDDNDDSEGDAGGDAGDGSDSDSDTDSDTDTDTDTDTNSDTDTDSDTDSDECSPTAEWGSGTGFTSGQPIANWSLNGLFDGDGDGEVDSDAADFTLEDIFCDGFNSVVVAVSDQDCGPCHDRYSNLASGGLMEKLADANSTLLMFFSGGLGASSKTAEQCYNYFSSNYEFDTGYYSGGPPNLFAFGFFPFIAVVDLTTGKLRAKDNDASSLSLLQISNLVNSINNSVDEK